MDAPPAAAQADRPEPETETFSREPKVTGVSSAAAQADRPEAEAFSREPLATGWCSVTGRPPARGAASPDEPRRVSEGRAVQRDLVHGAPPCSAQETDGPVPRRRRAAAAPRRCAALALEFLAARLSVPRRC